MPVIGCLLAFNATWLIFPRVKALLDIALFGTDVATDWINGYNLIIDEHIFWGTVMCLLPLITPAIVGPIAIFERSGNRRWYKILPFLILYIPFVLIATPVYIGFVLFTGILKLWDPELAKNGALCGMDGDKFVNASSIFRITEIATESCPQAMLGIYIQLILGPANDPKGCADWWVRQSRSWVRAHHDLASTYGLCHLNFQSLPGSNLTCALCINDATDSSDLETQSNNSVMNMAGQEDCDRKDCLCRRMFLTYETFATYWFPILFTLGIYCLLDAILSQCKDKEKDRTRWPTTYRLAERFVKDEEVDEDTNKDNEREEDHSYKDEDSDMNKEQEGDHSDNIIQNKETE